MFYSHSKTIYLVLKSVVPVVARALEGLQPGVSQNLQHLGSVFGLLYKQILVRTISESPATPMPNRVATANCGPEHE